MQKQIFQYIEKFLSPFLCGYRKGFSTQFALLGLVEKWKVSQDKRDMLRLYLWICQRQLIQ